MTAKSDYAKVLLQVDLYDKPATPLIHFWETVLGSDHAFMLTRYDLLDQVITVQDELGIENLRFHGIFMDDVRPLLDIDKPDLVTARNCDWWQVDLIYDALLARGIRPFVELSFMPEPLASDPNAHIFKYQGATSPPRSWKGWELFVEEFMRHLVKRYGRNEVSEWYFEVWNEPNLKAFWSGSMEDYFRLYDHAVVAIKRISPESKVGGPASAHGEWVQEMIDHCKTVNFADPNFEGKNGLKTPLDFVSYHFYPTDKPLANLKNDHGVQYIPPDRLAEVARRNFEIVRESGIPLEIHVTQWNSSSLLIDTLHDATNQAAFICETVKKVRPYVTALSYWCISDIFEEICLPGTEFSAGFGLLTRRGIPKPAYHAFRFLHQLGDEEISCKFQQAPQGINAWVTRNGSELQLCLWNYIHPLHPNPKDAEVEVEIAGMEQISPELNLTLWRLDDDHGNVTKRWTQLGSPANLSQEQLEHLRDVATLVPDYASVKNKDGRLKFQVTLPQKSVMFMKIAPRVE